MAISTVTVEINSKTATLTYDESSKKWTGSMTAPTTSSWSQPNHKFNVKVTATNEAGTTSSVTGQSVGFEEELNLRVKETTKPVIKIQTPSQGSYVITSLPKVTGTITDSGSGVKRDSIVVKIDTKDVTTQIQEAAGGLGLTGANDSSVGFSFTVPTALNDGSHTITIECTDNDDNSATSTSATFTVDTVSPTLTITSPEENLVTSETSINVIGTTNDEISTPVTVTIKVNSQDQGNVTVIEGAFTKAVNLDEGENEIIVTATDRAGKSTSVTRHVTLDTSTPKIVSVTLTPNPANVGASLTITVEVASDPSE